MTENILFYEPELPTKYQVGLSPVKPKLLSL